MAVKRQHRPSSFAQHLRFRHLASLRPRSMRAWLHLLDAAAYGDASMQLHRTTCMARLSSACGVECTTLRRLAARTRAQHASRCDLRSRCGTVQRRGVHGRTVRFGRCCRVLSGGQNVAKTRVDVCRVFSSHVQTLQRVSLCTVSFVCLYTQPQLSHVSYLPWVAVALRWRNDCVIRCSI